MVRYCKAMAREESRSGWNQVKEQVWIMNQEDWNNRKRGVRRSPRFLEKLSLSEKMFHWELDDVRAVIICRKTLQAKI